MRKRLPVMKVSVLPQLSSIPNRPGVESDSAWANNDRPFVDK